MGSSNPPTPSCPLESRGLGFDFGPINAMVKFGGRAQGDTTDLESRP